MAAVGVDVGGTSAKLGLVSDDGQVIQRAQFPTGRDLSPQALVAAVTEAVRPWRSLGSISRLGVAAPGMRRADGEGVVNVTNLPLLDGFALRQALQQATGWPVALDNDANAAAMGEYRFGGGQGASRLLVVTVGTGIGGGMVVEGRVHRIACEGLGDPGHVLVLADGPPCGCGGRGCVEALASVPAMLRRAVELGHPAGAGFGELVEAAKRGETPALSALLEGGRWLGMALATLTHLLAPDRLLLGGGGVDAAGSLLTGVVEEAYRACVQPYLAEQLTLGRAQLGNDAGMVGAAAMEPCA